MRKELGKSLQPSGHLFPPASSTLCRHLSPHCHLVILCFQEGVVIIFLFSSFPSSFPFIFPSLSIISLPLLLNSIRYGELFLICFQASLLLLKQITVLLDQSRICELKLLLPKFHIVWHWTPQGCPWSCFSLARNTGPKSKPAARWIQLPHVFEAKGKSLQREEMCWLKFTMKYKSLMSNLLLEQKFMEGKTDRKGVEPFKKRGALCRGEERQCTEGQLTMDLHFFLNLLYPSMSGI